MTAFQMIFCVVVISPEMPVSFIREEASLEALRRTNCSVHMMGRTLPHFAPYLPLLQNWGNGSKFHRGVEQMVTRSPNVNSFSLRVG